MIWPVSGSVIRNLFLTCQPVMTSKKSIFCFKWMEERPARTSRPGRTFWLAEAFEKSNQSRELGCCVTGIFFCFFIWLKSRAAIRIINKEIIA